MKRLLYLAVVLSGLPSLARAYIDRPPTLGRLIQYDATDIVVLRVEKVSKEKQVIVYRKVANLKGKYPADRVKQHITRRLTDPPHPEESPRPRDGQLILDWAVPGKVALFFHDGNNKVAATCIGNAWYMGFAGQDGWWNQNDFEERGLAWAYLGSVEKLRGHVAAILAGKEVVVTAARYDGHGGGIRELWNNQTAYRNLAGSRRVRIWRIKASLRITNYGDALADPSHFIVGLGSGDREAVPALVEALKARDPAARIRAVDDLGQVGPEARAALPALTEALKDAEARVRVHAAEAVWLIGREAGAAVPTLAAALKDKDVRVRRLAAEALREMGPEAQAAVGPLAAVLKDKDVEIRRLATETLWRVGSEAKTAVPALADALKDEDATVRRNAAGALGTFGPEAKAAVPALTEALKDKDLQTRHFAARALVRVGGPEAKRAAAPVLRDVLQQTPDQRTRAEIIAFLWHISAEPLKSLDPGDLHAATFLLKGVYSRKVDKETQRNAVPTLVAAFTATSDSGYRASFAHTLGEIGAEAKASIPALRAALQDKDEKVRQAAAEALKKIPQK